MTTNKESIKENEQLTEKQRQWKDAIQTTRNLTIIYHRATVNLMVLQDGNLNELEHYTKENIAYASDCDQNIFIEEVLCENKWDLRQAILADYKKNSYQYPKALAELEIDYWLKEFSLS